MHGAGTSVGARAAPFSYLGTSCSRAAPSRSESDASLSAGRPSQTSGIACAAVGRVSLFAGPPSCAAAHVTWRSCTLACRCAKFGQRRARACVSRTSLERRKKEVEIASGFPQLRTALGTPLCAPPCQRARSDSRRDEAGRDGTLACSVVHEGVVSVRERAGANERVAPRTRKVSLRTTKRALPTMRRSPPSRRRRPR